ncbi:hypothetical protein ACQ86N_17810 [Puia sp. P3]|uniref:hypothetical protein n=1 Tax=Puia sp. P3 TaxID=3423952 RepID=UPI003D66613A
MAEKYLKNPGERAGNGAGKAVLNEKEVQQGVVAVIALIRQVRDFVDAAAARRMTPMNLNGGRSPN